jgi:hypothetical protein
MKVSLVALSITGVLIAACSAIPSIPRIGGTAVVGSGTPADETRNVPPFAEVEITGALTADINDDGPQSVRVIGDDNIVPLIETTVSGERLTVGMKDKLGSISPNSDTKVMITVPQATYLGASGASTVTAFGLSSDSLQITVSGASKVMVGGETMDLQADVSGASSLLAGELSAQSAKATVSGASHSELNVSGQLVADASGASSVCYHGEPQVKPSTSGASTVAACP